MRDYTCIIIKYYTTCICIENWFELTIQPFWILRIRLKVHILIILKLKLDENKIIELTTLLHKKNLDWKSQELLVLRKIILNLYARWSAKPDDTS